MFTYKLQERRRLRHQDYKVPLHLQITRTSAFTLPRLEGSRSPTNYKNVTTRYGDHRFKLLKSRLCMRLFCMGEIDRSLPKMFWADIVCYSHEIYISPFTSFIAQQCFFIAYFAWGRAIIYLII